MPDGDGQSADPALAECNRGSELLRAGRLDEAASCFESALRIEPRFVEASFNLAFVRHEQGALEAAIGLYRATASMAPDFVGSFVNLGVLARTLGRTEEAIDAFRTVIRLDPGHADVQAGLAELLNATGRPAEAIAQFEAALALHPVDPRLRFGLGTTLLEEKHYPAALEQFDRAIEARHDLPGVHVNRAITLRALGRIDEARRSCEIAAVLGPEDAFVWMTEGDLLADEGLWKEAVVSYRRAVACDPQQAEAHGKLGVALTNARSASLALAPLNQALALQPDNAGHLGHLGNALAAMGRYDEALACLRRSLVLDPRQGATWCNLGVALNDLNCHEEALDCFAQARALSDDTTVVDYDESAIRLARGEFELGWRLYECRRSVVRAPANWGFNVPQWRGEEDLAGHTLFVHAEQGSGDIIQFARYLPLVADRGARVLARIPVALRDLLASVDPRVTLVESDPPPFDLHCPLMSLPLAFGTTVETIPATIPYLQVPAASAARWRERLGPPRRLRVGLVWAGNPDHAGDRHRSMPFASLAPLLTLGEIEFVSLQKEIRPADRADYDAARNLARAGECLEDFADTAGLLSQLDLIVSVDTGVAHLAGALARPVWLMLPWNPEWRWMHGRTDSPWYPTARLFRQAVRGDWAGLVDRIAEALRAECLLWHPAATT